MKNKGVGFLRDEQGGWSASRVLLFVWTANILAQIWYSLLYKVPIDAAILTLDGSIESFLIGWAGGPRIMQYVAPNVAKVADAIAKARKSKERDPENGWDPTPE